MKSIIKLVLLFVLTLTLFSTSAVIVVGCKTPPTAVAAASARGLADATVAAENVFADYVVREQRAIAALPAIERGPRTTELLRAEGRFIELRGANQRAFTAYAASALTTNVSVAEITITTKALVDFAKQYVK